MGTVHAKAAGIDEGGMGDTLTAGVGEGVGGGLFDFDDTDVEDTPISKPTIRLNGVRARVDRVHVEGLVRTCDDVIRGTVQPLFHAGDFEDVIVRAHRVRRALADLGCFNNVAVHIDVSGGPAATPEGLEVTFRVSELSRVVGGVNTMVGDNEGSLVLGVKLPNVLGRGERVAAEYSLGHRSSSNFSVVATKPLPLRPLAPTLSATLYQQAHEAPWSGYRSVEKGVLVETAFRTGPFTDHKLQWEGLVRDLAVLGKSAAFPVRSAAGPQLKSLVRHIVTVDARDEPVFPTRGHLVRFTSEVAIHAASLATRPSTGADVSSTTFHHRPPSRLPSTVPSTVHRVGDMDRDYRLLGLNYNRLLERQEEQAERRSRRTRAGAEPPPPPHPHPLAPGGGGARYWSFTQSSESMAVCEEPQLQAVTTTSTVSTLQVPDLQPHYIRKRKSSSFGSASVYDGSSEDSRSVRTLPEFKKQTHSEIEKRRRDKMNTYISQLSSMVPTCGAMPKKLDKITVLKMVVQYLRGIEGASAANPWASVPSPEHLPDRDLNELVVRAARGAVLFVVGCDGGRLLYVSASIQKMLHYDQSELLGQSVFDLLHPNDIAMFKSQLSASGTSSRERFLDVDVRGDAGEGVAGRGAGAGGSRFCSGARRSFFCRIKLKSPPEQRRGGGRVSQTVKADPDSTATYDYTRKRDKKYCVLQCTGYLKSWPSSEISEMSSPGECGGECGGEETDTDNLSCLVAVGRSLADMVQQPPDLVEQPPTRPERSPEQVEQPPPAPPTRLLQYMSRHAIDGKFLFVDPRVTLALGYLPHEVVGTGLHQHVSGADLETVARTYRAALRRRETLLTPTYHFRRKDGSLATLQTHFKPFKNPWTKEEEHLVANNTVVQETGVASGGGGGSSPSPAASGGVFKQDAPCDLTQLLPAPPNDAPAPTPAPAPAPAPVRRDPLLAEHTAAGLLAPTDLVQGLLFDVEQGVSAEASLFEVRTDVVMGGAPPSPPAAVSPGGGGEGEEASNVELDGNDEAAMSIIMSLLEADAGLGGPVNLSGLPWPLP